MYFNRYILFVFLSLITGGLSWYVVLIRLNPEVTPFLALSLFFITLFFFSSSLFTLIGYYIRVLLYRNELFLNHFNISLRQGVLGGIFSCLLLGLQTIRMLSLWTGLLFLFLMLLMEVYFVAQE